MVKFKTEDQKLLGKLLIFTPIPLDAQDVWSLNQFLRREYWVSNTHIQTIHSLRDLNENPYESLLWKP